MTKVRAVLLVALAATFSTAILLTRPRPATTPATPVTDVTPALNPTNPGSPAGRPTDSPEPGPGNSAPSGSEALRPLGAQWDSAPAGSPFARFADWAAGYQNAGTDEGRAELEAEGILLATERRVAMHALIQSDPRRALEFSIPLNVRDALPAAVNNLLESRLSGRGDFSVLAAYPPFTMSDPAGAAGAAGPDQPDHFIAVRRTLSFGGVDYQAFVYGARTDHPTRRNLPVNGVAVDDVMAVSENPVRVLERGEVRRLSRTPAKEAVCGVSAEPVTVVDEATPVDVGGEITWICRFAHAEVLNSQLLLAASQPGTGFLGDGGLAESPYTEGRKRVIMFRVAFSNLPTPDISSNQLVTVHAGVDNFWRQNSYGQTHLAPLGAGSDIVQVTLSSPSTAYDGDAGALRTAVRSRATAQGIDLSNYDFDVIYTGGGRPSFDFGGLGFVGAPGSWVVGASTSITSHEMGHNLGNPHANFWDTGGMTAIGTGDNQEYGDPYDVMGGGSASGAAAGHYVSKFKWRIGWIPDADFPRIASGGTYRIYAHDINTASGLRGVRITKTNSLEYFLEFRQLYTGNRWLTDGLGLRWGNPNSWSAQLIDTTPGSAGGKTDSAIAIGRTFSDTAAGVHITPIGKGHTHPESIDVVVQLGSQAGNQPPAAVVSASTINAAVGAPVTFTASASDPNGDRLAYYWEFSDSAANFSTDNSPVQTVSFGSAGEYNARCVVSDMRGGIASQTIVVRVGTPSTFRIGGHILDGQNRPVAGVLVTAAGPSAVSTFTDSDGSYVIPGLTAGSYAVSAQESIAGSMAFIRAYFSNPVSIGPNFMTADFVGVPGSVNIYTPLVAKNSTGWRYNDTGTDLGTAWRSPSFNDAPWSTGTAPLGYPSGNPITTVVGFGPDAANKYPTTYFRKQFSVINPAVYTNLLVELLRDDSAVVYLNGVELVRDNLPAGNITYSTYASANSGADAYLPTTVPRTALVAGNNVLAVEVHQANASSSDIVMDAALSALSVSNVTGLKLVYFTEPANGAPVTGPTNLTLRASVLAGGTPATRVDYYANGAKVAESTAAPYTAQWVNPANGTHTLTAVAVVGTGTITTPAIRIVVGPAVPPLPTQELIAANAAWRYLAQASAAPATWAAPGFNDAAWPSGPAELGFGDGDEATVVPGGPNNNRYSTIYFRKTFTVDDPAAVQTLNALLKRDDGAIVHLNGTEVVRDNIAAGTVTYATLAASADDDGDAIFSHSLPVSGLVHGLNTIAVEVHQSAITSSDLSFQLAVSAVLRTNRTRGCWITSPSPGATIDLPGSVTIHAEVVAGNGLGVSKVEFFANGAKIAEDTTAPFSFTWANPPSGARSLTAIATDSAAQTIASAPVNVTVGTPPLGTAFVSFGDVWKYRDDGADPGSAWTGRFYNDSTWKSGAAKLGYNTPSLTTTVSYGPDANNKHITTYFRRGFNLPSVAGLNGLLLRLVRDDGAVVYLNGAEIHRDNLQAGPVSWNSTALAAVSAPEDSTPIDLILPVTGLVSGSNMVTVEIHQANPTSSDIAFNLALTGLTQTNATSGLYLSSPARNAHYNSPATIPVAAFVPETPTGAVEFFANGVKIGEDSTAPYEFTWNGPPIGTHSVTARATLNGSPATSPAVDVTVGTPPPPITPVYQALIGSGTSWRYLDTAEAVPPDWNQRAFNDAAWPAGNTRFGHGLDGEATLLTAGRTTHYFRRWFNAPNPVLYSSLLFQLARDDGAIAYLNGMEIFRSNMPTGPVNGGTLASATVNTPEETQFFEFALASNGSGLLTGSNLLAVELHQASENSSDAGFDLALHGIGTTEPRVFIGSPVQSATVAYGRTLPVEVFASAGPLETVSLVEIFINGAPVAEVSTAPYRIDWTFTEFGPQILTARMTTSTGASVQANPVQVTVSRQAVSTQFIAAGSGWKYLDDGSSAGTSANPAWAQPAFNDAAWPAGPARFGYGGDGEVTTVRETRTDSTRIITFYFRRSFTVQPGAVYTNLQFNLLRDDGAVVYLNGREVFRSNMPGGTIGYTTLSPAAVGGADEQTFFPTSVTVTNLPAGTNVVGVEVHQQSTTSSDLAFDLTLQASGYAEDTTPPQLAVLYSDGFVELSWPATFVGWRAYASPAIGAAWTPLAQTPFLVNGRNVIALPPAGSQQFFRLGKP